MKGLAFHVDDLLCWVPFVSDQKNRSVFRLFCFNVFHALVKENIFLI